MEDIQDHRADFEDVSELKGAESLHIYAQPSVQQGQMRYHVKWKGYEKKADRTWETEDNLE